MEFTDGQTVTAAELNTINALTATTLQTPRAINGIAFDGSAPITIPVTSPTDLANATDPTKGVSLVGGAARVVASIAALRTLPKAGSPEAFVAGYYVQGDGGGGAYWYNSTDTTSADNGGTIIVASDGGRWYLASTSSVSLRQFGATGNGTTSDVTAYNNAIAYLNTLTSGGTLYIPDGQYNLTAGSLTPIAVGNVFLVGSSSTGALILLPSGSVGIAFGNSTSTLFVGGGARSLSFGYSGNPAVGSIVFQFQNVSRLQFHDISLVNTRTLFSCGVSSGRAASSITASDIRGFVYNGGNFPVYDLRYGAGLYLTNNQVFVGGVLAPVAPAAMTTAANTNVFNGNAGTWDTVIASNCIWERFDGGIVIQAANGFVYQDWFFSNCIFDYHSSNVVNINASTGGVVSTIRMKNCWFVSWSGPAILISGAGYNDWNEFDGVVPIAGQEAVFYGVTGSNSNKFSLTIGAVNRLATTSNAAMYFVAGSTGFIVSGCQGNDNNTGIGFSWRAAYGISIGANCDLFEVTGNRVSGSSAGYIAAINTSGSKNRRVSNNASASYAGTALGVALAGTGAVLTNLYSFSVDYLVYGGTVGGISKNSNGISGMTSGMLRLDPGETITINYTVAPSLTTIGVA